jgi:hypothetical protein
MPHLIQILLPAKVKGTKTSPALFEAVRDELTEQFGGLTVYSQAPAEGLWESGDDLVRDEMVLFEIMVDAIEPDWWRHYRRELERRFEQQEVLIRASEFQKL